MSAFLASALQSGVILFREGLEALLIIAALAGFLRRAGAHHALHTLYTGAVAALLTSVIGAVVMAVYLGGSHDDRLEAAIMAVAAILMFYMSGWLFLKQDPRTMMAALKQSADSAMSRGTVLSIALLAFLAVAREGAETILFLHALARTEGGWSLALVSGIAGASVLLLILFIAMQWFAVHLPLRPVFLITSAILFVMALKFVSQTIQELQEQTILSFTPTNLPGYLSFFDSNGSWEALGLQIAIGAIALVSTACAYLRQRQQLAAGSIAAE